MTAGASPRRGRPAAGPTAFGIAVAALGLVVGWDAARLPPAPAYARIGPALFPAIVAVHLVGIGLVLAVQGVRGRPAPPPRLAGPLDGRALALVGLGLAGQAVLMEPLGFWLASAFLFAVVSRAFGSRRPLWDLSLGMALGVAAQVAFVAGLGLTLPAGALAGLF